MKSFDTINAEIDQFIRTNYYSEDYELASLMKNYQEKLSSDDEAVFREVIVHRILTDPSLVNITLCARLHIPPLVPLLTALLNRETISSQRSRAIISALRHYSDEDAFRAVERFVDSEQQHEALLQLARIDFKRFRPYFMRAMRQDHLIDHCLHILYERKKAVGLSTLIMELKPWASTHPRWFRERIKNILHCKQGKYNPFTEEEIEQIQNAFNEKSA